MTVAVAVGLTLMVGEGLVEGVGLVEAELVTEMVPLALMDLEVQSIADTT